MQQRLPLFALFAAALAMGACSDPPEGPGDECDIDDDDCPAGLVCQAQGDEDICKIRDDETCDPNGVNYCTDGSTCLETSDGSFTCGAPQTEGSECDPTNQRCEGTLVCAEIASGGHRCFQPVLLKGMVFDATDTSPIEAAHVLAFDDQKSALTDVAISDGAGNYELSVPIPRGDDGAPVGDVIVTLRGSAQDYQTFPGGIRTALPINSSEAVAEGDGWTLQSAVTDVALIPLPDDEKGQPSITGAVLAGDLSGGVLVVAEGGATGISAVSDTSGAYTIFNVPAGSYTVNGYAADVQLDPVDAEVASAALTGIDLAESGDALGSITGSLNIVNAPGGSATSVVLVVASTFSDTFVRGEVPRGLRTPLSGPPDVTSSFTITGVPAGSYVVLAAFENDDLVRDPDPNIAGTQIVTVDMPRPGNDVDLTDSFKITEALAVVSPGANEAEEVSGSVTLEWADDSSEDFYEVVVFNAYGEEVWSDLMVPGVSGGGTVTVSYGGPLDPGMYYQFRATSFRQQGMGAPGAIATTEDLRGVFFVASP